ncbi:MAG TPA: hypothetical protein VN577_22475 [Terriglobales bacterium]|nr:hypothetical protein [Terriglobales bacterium]
MSSPVPSSMPPFPEEPSTQNGKLLRKSAVVIAAGLALLVFAVTSAADLIMLYRHEPVHLTLEISDGISAIVIGALCYRVIKLEQLRRERLRQKLEVIADMNHHVRNALQVISLTTHSNNKEEINTIRESVNRIQWALRELLPKL